MPGKNQKTITVHNLTWDLINQVAKLENRSIPREIHFLAERRIEELTTEPKLHES